MMQMSTLRLPAAVLTGLLLVGCTQQPAPDAVPTTESAPASEDAGAPASPSGDEQRTGEQGADQGAGQDSGQPSSQAEPAAGLPEVSSDTCAAFGEFQQGFPRNTESDPQAAAEWMEKQAAAGDRQYEGQLRGLARATRSFADGHKPLDALRGQMRGLEQRCAHRG